MKYSPNETADYLIARISASKHKATFSVAKFDGSDQPESVYVVTVTKKEVSCTCPGYTKPDVKKPCRHCKMVAAWVMNGEQEDHPLNL